MSERINRRADQPAETILSPEARATVNEVASIDEQIAALEARRTEMNAEAARADAWGTSDPIMTFDADGKHADFDDYLKMRTDAENTANEEPTFEGTDLKSLSLMQLVSEGRKMNELGDIAGKGDVLNAMQDQLAERAVAEDWTEKELIFQLDRFNGLIDADASKSAQGNTENTASVTSTAESGLLDRGVVNAALVDAMNAKIAMAEMTPESPMTAANGERLYTSEEADAILRAAREESDARALALLDAEPDGEFLPVDSTIDVVDVPAEQSLSDELINEAAANEQTPEKTGRLNELKMSIAAGIGALAARFNKNREQKRVSRENETDADREKRVTGNKKKALGLLAIVGVAAGIGGPIAADRLQDEHHDTSSDNVASAPQSIENANNDILAQVNTPEVSAEHIAVVTPEAVSVAEGGGLYELLGEDLGTPNNELEALVSKIGPELVSMDYAYVDAYSGEYRISKAGPVPADVLELIQNNR